MKTINLRGITESMSEREMKLVKGGGKNDERMVQPEESLTSAENLCKDVTIEGWPCKIPNSLGGFNWGTCKKNSNKRLECN